MERYSEETSRLIAVPKVADPRGNLSFIQHPGACPFPIERVYWIYDIPADGVRNRRALRDTAEFIVALSGAFDVVIETAGGERQTFHLDRCYRGVYVAPGTFRTINNFTSNSVAMVLASATYDPDEYIY